VRRFVALSVLSGFFLFTKDCTLAQVLYCRFASIVATVGYQLTVLRPCKILHLYAVQPSFRDRVSLANRG
jgi:hypothetical protein